MLATINGDESYKVKTMTEATYEEEEGEFASSESPKSKRVGVKSLNKNYLFVAPLPSFCKVNPNLPNSKTNQQQTIVHGIQRVSEGPDEISATNPSELGKRYRLSDFDKIEKIGEGTFGKVYKAEYHDPETGKTQLFALKKLNMIMDDMTD